MSSSDRDTEASPKKTIKWYTQQLNVECSKDPDLKDWL